MSNPYKCRLPMALQAVPADHTPPTTAWLNGTWHVTHSSLSLWNDKRNVKLNYKLLEPAADGSARLEDRAEYQALTSDKVKTIHGVDTATGNTGSWDWRGNGWLKVAGTSHWEILGYGDLEGGNSWALTYFSKTLFTAAGMDIISRNKGGLPAEVVEQIRKSLETLEDEDLKKIAASLVDVKYE